MAIKAEDKLLQYMEKGDDNDWYYYRNIYWRKFFNESR
jgi:hypothetical protein